MSIKQVYKTTNMYYYAQLYSREMTEEEEILKHDWSKLFWDDILFLLKSNKLINININAQVREGKSLLGITMGWNIQDLMIKLGQTQKEFNIHNIARNQYEASKIFRDKDLFRQCIVVDEVAELEDTGENVTGEIALRNEMSDIHAMNYIHKIWISPKARPDKNSDIFIEVVAPDKKNMTTHCKLYFEVFNRGIEYRQLLGYINFDVSPLLKNWLTIEEDYYKGINQDVIDKLRKKDFYVDYMYRKREKIKLMREHNVMKSRDLDYASITLDTVNEIKPMIKLKYVLGRSFNYRKYIKTVIEERFQNRGMPLTILGKNEATDRVEGMLDVYELYEGTSREITKYYSKLEKTNDETLKEKYTVIINMLEIERDKLREKYLNKENYFKRMIELNEKYNAHKI